MKEKYISLLFATLLLLTGCTKTDVRFADNSSANDPNIIYYENYPVDIATYKIDSFITSGHNALTIGYHNDASFGSIHASGYAEISFPAENPLKNQDVIFDSLVILLKPQGDYYGDTTVPVHFIVNKLSENIKNTDEENINFYNTRTFATDPVPAGEKNVLVRPGKDTSICIRLSDTFGQELFQKFKTNATDIQNETSFLKYLKGLRISVDTATTNTLYYFTVAADSLVMQLHYRQNATFYQEKTFDFKINTQKQCNFIRFNHLNTALSVFTPYKKQLKESKLTANMAYLNSNLGSTIKISFPSLFSLKELYPYVQIMKAELLIKPSSGTYSYPYQLPPELNLYVTDDGNSPISVLTDVTGQTALTGDLSIDKLYGVNTKYTYDITTYIKALIAEGIFSNSALLLVSPSGTTESTLDRLVVNDQVLGNGIQLKLYVLGL